MRFEFEVEALGPDGEPAAATELAADRPLVAVGLDDPAAPLLA